jgi:cytochrome P450
VTTESPAPTTLDGPDGSDGPEALVRALLTAPFQTDPYPLYNRLRTIAPVYRSESGLWFASDYSTCETLFRSPVFGVGLRLQDNPRFGDSSSLQLLGHMMPFLDPPDHTRIRRSVSSFFAPRAVQHLRGFAAQLVDRLLDQLSAAGGGDLLSDFARQIPIAVMCEMLGGVATDDQERCCAWSDALVEASQPVTDDAMLRRADAAADEFRAYFGQIIANRRARPADDMMGTMVAENDRTGALSEDEFLAMTTILVGAAYHNTANAIANGIWTLLHHPAQLALLRAQPARAKAAVEELLRFEPPAQLTIPRVASEDVELGGATVPAGELVCGVLGAAHRDPLRYRNPDQLDIGRDDGGSLALAFGIHSCIGAAVARLETEIAITSFIERFTEITMEDTEPELHVACLPSLRSFESLMITVA